MSLCVKMGFSDRLNVYLTRWGKLYSTSLSRVQAIVLCSLGKNEASAKRVWNRVAEFFSSI